MKKINGKEFTLFLTAAFLLCSTAAAQDFGDFNDFGSFGDSAGSSPAVTVNGKAGLEVRGYTDNNSNATDIEAKAIPQAALGFEYKGNNSDSVLKLKLNEDVIKNHPFDVVDEIEINAFFGPVTVTAGKMKNVWGKGDKLHVIDNFNADDYTDFIIPDYLDRRVSTPMIIAGVDFGTANLHLEGVYTPLLPVDRFATTGRWTPSQVRTLTDSVKTAATSQVAQSFKEYNSALISTSLVMGKYSEAGTAYQAAAQAYKADPTDPAKGQTFLTAQAAYNRALEAANAAQNQLTAAGTSYMTALTNANALNSAQDSVYPDLKTLKYGQFGARLTGTAGPVDLGLSYYNGYFKQPSCNVEKMGTWISKTLAGCATEDDKFLAYDSKQTFGAEFATTLWHFNLRGEFAYNLTKDVKGDDPWVHNNSIAWLGGFDIDLPLWNMNLNIQETGTYVLNNNEVDKNKLDVDYSNTGYSANKLVVNLSASFANDKVVPEVTFVYGIEKCDIAVLPKLSYKMSDGLSFSASGLYIWSKNSDGEFYTWRNNSFVSLGAFYQF